MEVVIDATLDFWDVYPAFKSIEPFKEFYKGNDRKDSSKLMWFVVYCYNVDSPFYNMLEKDKLVIVADSVLGDKDYYKHHSEEVDYLSEPYCKAQDSAADRQLRMWNEKMDEKTSFLERTKYDGETGEMIDKMLKANQQMFDIRKKIDSEREKERTSTMKGGGRISEADKGII